MIKLAIQFIKDYKVGNKLFKTNEVYKNDNNTHIEYLNEELLIVIYHGVRYDIKKDSVKILKVG